MIKRNKLEDGETIDGFYLSFGSVRKIKIVRLSEKSVWFNTKDRNGSPQGYTTHELKKTMDHEWFETFEAAKSSLVKRLSNDFRSIDDSLHRARNRLTNAKELTE